MKELVQYVRKGGSKKFVTISGRKKRSKCAGGKRVGVMVGWKSHNGELKAGWSLCHKIDEFDSIDGLVRAKKRSFPVVNNVNARLILPEGIPKTINRKFEKFIDRLVNCHKEVEDGIAEGTAA